MFTPILLFQSKGNNFEDSSTVREADSLPRGNNFYVNTQSRTDFDYEEPKEVFDFHRGLEGYAATPLIDSPGLASRLGVAHVWVKDESVRIGLPSFKVLGASWATARAVAERLGVRTPLRVEDLRSQLLSASGISLSAATDGNHGRAVARIATLFGLPSHIYVPKGTVAARISAIEGEGAKVTIVDGTYDMTVERAACDAGPGTLIIQDTAWPGYQDVPSWVIDGYSTIMLEIDEQLAARSDERPDIVVVQIGVGAFAAAVVRHVRCAETRIPAVLGVEPVSAACVQASMRAGSIVSVPGPHDSIMAGLNCGTPSSIAWPVLSHGIDAMISITDEVARQAMRELAYAGVVSGESGAAGLGGLLDVANGDCMESVREILRMNPKSNVLIFSTEGATDPELYAEIIGEGG